MRILLTGMAGFIGYHTALRLAQQGNVVIGLDNINDYYDVNLKYARLEQLGFSRQQAESGVLETSARFPSLQFIKMDLMDRTGLNNLVKDGNPDAICHLAAQAGVRYSLTNPHAYLHSNLEGFLNILEAARATAIGHLVYASSSSVYGLNSKQPFSADDNVDHPVSLYAASKKSNELMAHSYSHLYGIPTTGLRFFTVYGPWGRPDMAIYLFTKAIFEGKPIEVFNNGELLRDFTYVDDIVDGLLKVLATAPRANPAWSTDSGAVHQSSAPYRIYNIGNGSPVRLMDFIGAIEAATGVQATKVFKPMQAGDVVTTWADTRELQADFGVRPRVGVQEGIGHFVAWFRSYYHV